MRLGVASEGCQSEPVGVLTIKTRDSTGQIAAAVVEGADRRREISGREQSKCLRRIRHPLVREHLDIGRMRDRQKPKSIEEDSFFELVGDPQLVASIFRLE